MSDKVTDSQAPSSEVQETPNPVLSQDSRSSSPDDLDALIDPLIERLTPAMTKVFERVAQSDKDKGIASAKKDASKALEGMADMRETVAKFKQYVERFGDDETALYEMERDQKIEQAISGGNSKPSESVGTDTRPWSVRQKEILESAGLEETDKRAIEFAQSKEWKDYDEYLSALEAETFSWRMADVRKPSPDASTLANTQSPLPQKMSSFDGVSSDDLGNRLVDLQRNFSENEDEIRRITDELEARDAN